MEIAKKGKLKEGTCKKEQKNCQKEKQNKNSTIMMKTKRLTVRQIKNKKNFIRFNLNFK